MEPVVPKSRRQRKALRKRQYVKYIKFLRKQLCRRNGVEIKPAKQREGYLQHIGTHFTQQAVMMYNVHADSFWTNYTIAQEWQNRHSAIWWKSRCIALEQENTILQDKIRLLVCQNHNRNANKKGKKNPYITERNMQKAYEYEKIVLNTDMNYFTDLFPTEHNTQEESADKSDCKTEINATDSTMTEMKKLRSIKAKDTHMLKQLLNDNSGELYASENTPIFKDREGHLKEDRLFEVLNELGEIKDVMKITSCSTINLKKNQPRLPRQDYLKQQNMLKESASESDDNIELNVTEDMLNFLETTERHRMEMQKKRRSESAATKRQEEEEETEEEEEGEYITSHKNLRKVYKKAELLYGEDTSKITSIEEGLQSAAERYKDSSNARFWPNISLKP